MKSKLFNGLSAAVQKGLKEACTDIEKKAQEIENEFILIGKGVVGGLTEGYNILSDIYSMSPVGLADAGVDALVAQAQEYLSTATSTAGTATTNSPEVQDVISQVIQQATDDLDVGIAYRQAMNSAQASGNAQAIAEAEALAAALAQKIAASETALSFLTTQVKKDIVEKASAIKAHVARIKHPIYDAWAEKVKALTSKGTTGIEYIPHEAVEGAKEAMNDKYGEGSVIW